MDKPCQRELHINHRLVQQQRIYKLRPLQLMELHRTTGVEARHHDHHIIPSDIHHVIKRSQGGGDQPDNLITLCMYCHAVIHGTRFPDMPDWMDQAELNQAAVEYVADHYAGSWWPWAKNYMEMREGG